jgi:hypothetical protein
MNAPINSNGGTTMPINKAYLTRKELMEATGVKHYTITYLTLTGKLPLIRKATGKGSITLYDPAAQTVLERYKNEAIERGE